MECESTHPGRSNFYAHRFLPYHNLAGIAVYANPISILYLLHWVNPARKLCHGWNPHAGCRSAQARIHSGRHPSCRSGSGNISALKMGRESIGPLPSRHYQYHPGDAFSVVDVAFFINNPINIPQCSRISGNSIGTDQSVALCHSRVGAPAVQYPYFFIFHTPVTAASKHSSGEP